MFDELLSALTIDQLKPRLALLQTRERPSRKADIIALPALMHLVESGQIGVSDKTGLATAASLRKIDPVLMGGDFYSDVDEQGLKKWDPGPLRPIRPYAWPLLLQTGGLAKRNGNKLDLTVSEDLHIDLVRAAEPGELLLLDRYAAWISEQTWLLTSDPATREHCLQGGAKILVVPEKAEKGFRKGLRKLGYIFPAS